MLYDLEDTVLAVTGKATARQLAHQADTLLFGPEEVTEAQAAAFWDTVDTAVVELGRGRSRWRRVTAAVNPVTLIPARPAGVRRPATLPALLRSRTAGAQP